MAEHDDAAVSHRVTKLDADACWRLLQTQSLGRLVIAADRIEIFPVNFLVYERAVYFASAPGTKMMALTESPQVAFEVDGEESDLVWSVVLRGRAVRLASDTEIEASGILRLHAMHPTKKRNYVRIAPDTISGREFRPMP